MDLDFLTSYKNKSHKNKKTNKPKGKNTFKDEDDFQSKNEKK